MIVVSMPLRLMVRPTTCLSPPKRVRQNRSTYQHRTLRSNLFVAYLEITPELRR